MARVSSVLAVAVAVAAGCEPDGDPVDALSPSPIVVSSEEVRPEAASQNIVAEAHLLEPGSPLRHEDPESGWKAGTYRLIVSCAGNGDLRVGFRIGTVTSQQNLRTCAPGGGYSAIDLQVDADSSGHSVEVSSIGDANGAVAYAVRRRTP